MRLYRRAVYILFFMLAAALLVPASGAAEYGRLSLSDNGEPVISRDYAWLNIGLVYHNPFEEGEGSTAAAAVGSTPAQLVNAEWVDGVIGKAVSFNGSDAYAIIDKSKYGDADGNVTIAFWAQVRTIDNIPSKEDFTTLLSSVGYSSQYEFRLMYRKSTWYRMAMIINGENTNVSSNWMTYQEVRRRWVHYTVVFNTQRWNIRYFIDGMLLVEDWMPGKIKLGPLSIAAFTTGIDRKPSNYCDMAIDDLRIYSRALSSDEIALLAAGGYPPDFSEVWPPDNSDTGNSYGASDYIAAAAVLIIFLLAASFAAAMAFDLPIIRKVFGNEI